ncbi:MAG TPA: BON domain-containing protein [Chitinophagaceae bacterium]|nr:BON domain-containing protein [Chitinophagaceae bacterium]
MKITKIMFSLLLMSSLFFIGCGQKDSDIKASVEEKLKTNTDMAGPMTVSVNDGVVTLTGTCNDETCRAKCEELAKSAKGVKSVVNNCTVAAAAPVQTSTDDALTTGVRDATKDHPTVQASVNNGVVTLTGEIKRDQLQKLMQTLNTLNPAKIENKLTIK